MKVKFATAFTTVLSVLALTIQAQAQSPVTPVTPNTLTDSYTIKGDSLTGVDNRTSEDFPTFFSGSSSLSLSETTNSSLPLGQRFNLPTNLPLILQPAKPGNGNDNDGFQLQVDLQGVGGGNQQ